MADSRSPRRLVDERVATIEALMRRCQWERGRTNRALAEQWNVSVNVVNDYAAEAGRRVRAEVTNPNEVQETVCTALSAVVRDGLKEKDRRAVVAAGDVWTRIVGARAPEKHEHAHTQAQAEWEKLPPVERPAWLRAQAARFLAAAEAAEEELRDAAALTVGVAKE